MRISNRRIAANHQLVLDALRAAERPMTAYELLDAVRPAGITAPPTVYRALKRLIDDGRVHRVESLNAFVACGESHQEHSPVLFMICDECGDTKEVADSRTAARLSRCAAESDFAVQSTTVELHGSCGNCTEKSSRAE